MGARMESIVDGRSAVGLVREIREKCGDDLVVELFNFLDGDAREEFFDALGDAAAIVRPDLFEDG